ncbi:MAG TPA: NAD(P)/FAD-dependent oxidoreductase [Marmoricola sp.]|nr:NAD(P)/FAD-dependent oxidoreductase [Marmoricola sp.]
MSTEVSCDVVVLGLGPGGEHAAAELAKAGLEVVGIDERLVGGECPYFGCVPTKMMIAASTALHEGRRVAKLAGSATIDPSWDPVARRIRDEATDDWDDTVAVKRLEDAGVTFARGRGVITAPGQVSVGDTTYAARKGVVLNTGTSPSAPPVDGLDTVEYWTNRDVVQLTELPASIIVIGGGAIGCELAQVLAEFGVTVTVLEAADRLVAMEEPEASQVLEKAFADLGIEVVTGARIEEVSHDGDGFVAQLPDRSIRAERLLVAAGRRNNIGDIGLEHVGLDPAAKVLDPDERMRVAEGVWAIGDITGKGAFTHMSMYQADVVIRDLLDKDGPWADYRAVSRVTFTGPEIGAVGMTEKQARDAGLRVSTGVTDLASSTRGWIAQEAGVIKVVADDDRGVLVGATAVGPSGGEVISMLTTAVHAQVPVETLRTMHFAYPTYHRAIESALADL